MLKPCVEKLVGISHTVTMKEAIIKAKTARNVVIIIIPVVQTQLSALYVPYANIINIPAKTNHTIVDINDPKNKIDTTSGCNPSNCHAGISNTNDAEYCANIRNIEAKRTHRIIKIIIVLGISIKSYTPTFLIN